MKNTKRYTTFALSLMLLLALAACQPIVAPTTEPDADAGTIPGAANTLSAQALQNATYSGIYDEPVTLVDGLYEGDPYVAGGASRPTVRYRPNSAYYGDLDGDGVDDAVVFLVESGGGSGNFVYVAAQLNQGGQPVDAGAVMVEDRTQVRSVTIKDGQIAVEFTTAGPGDGACCPSHMVQKTYALQEGQLAEVGGGGEPVRVSAADLDGTSWRLVELGENEPVADEVEITIAFADGQISGSGGCNRYTGSFSLSDDNPFLVTFGPIAATRMLCPDPAGSQEAAYFNALGAATIWGYDFGDLVLSYGSGDARDRLLFTAQPEAGAESETGAAAAESLTGITWQWVGLTDPMQQVEIDAPESYTLTFLEDGSLQIQADCNRATASYTATEDGSLEVTPGIMTLALCGPESRSEELIQKLGFAARYFFQDGHLFIDMMADGGTLEFQP
ncbi:MAG TPA: META domain-containing protein [Caldilineaceae bacterium]|nr:META domain-containing protein [Caldilineaceae bacterium]